MRTNLDGRERMLRSLVIAPAAIVAALLVGAGSLLGVALLAVAVLMVATSAVSFCPLYALLRRNRDQPRKPLTH